MLASGIPAKFPIVWGASAVYIRSIPTTSQIGINNGFASLPDGFVPLNQTPVAGGGVPPFIQDMNGILNEMCAWLQWQQAGAVVTYDSTFQTAVSGYPKGAIVQSATTPFTFWISTADSNTTNPDASGAGWSPYGRIKLPANTTFYVSASGSDSTNTGLSGGSPWATLQHAYVVLAANYDLNGFQATINVSGALTGTLIAFAPLVGQTLPLVISTDGGSSVATVGTTIAATNGANLSVIGTGTLSSSGSNVMTATSGGSIAYSGVTFGASIAGAHVVAQNGGFINAVGNYSISAGSSDAHFRALQNGSINVAAAVTITLTGTPAFNSAFAVASSNATLSAASASFSGSATGTRYSAILNGVIDTGGGGANYFPGSGAGSTSSGGQYA